MLKYLLFAAEGGQNFTKISHFDINFKGGRGSSSHQEGGQILERQEGGSPPLPPRRAHVCHGRKDPSIKREDLSTLRDAWPYRREDYPYRREDYPLRREDLLAIQRDEDDESVFK